VDVLFVDDLLTMDQELIEQIVERVLDKLKAAERETKGATRAEELVTEDIRRGRVPVGVSARHVHLRADHFAALFGKEATLTVLRPLKQTGEFASEQQVTLVAPSGKCLGPVRILGPLRKASQVELSLTDCFALGLKRVPPVRPSGDHRDTPGITLVGPVGAVTLDSGVIRANRHIHLHTDQAVAMGLKDKDIVAVRLSGERPGILLDVQVRVAESFRAELHLDTDDANAFGVKTGDTAEVILHKMP